MLKKSKLLSTALGIALMSVFGIACADGFYPDDNGGCTGGTFYVSDTAYNLTAVYQFPAMANGNFASVTGTVYDQYGRTSSSFVQFSCQDGWVSYNGPFYEDPSWE